MRWMWSWLGAPLGLGGEVVGEEVTKLVEHMGLGDLARGAVGEIDSIIAWVIGDTADFEADQRADGSSHDGRVIVVIGTKAGGVHDLYSGSERIRSWWMNWRRISAIARADVRSSFAIQPSVLVLMAAVS